MKKDKSILIVTERFYPEDFGINDLARTWQKKGYKVGVLTQAPSYPFDKVYKGYKNVLFQTEKWSGIKIYRVFSLMGYKKSLSLKILNYICYAILASIISIFIGRKYNNIFVYHVGPLTQALPATLLKIIFKSKCYIWTLDIWPDTVYAYGFKKRHVLDGLLNLFIKIVYRNCNTVFISCKGFEQKIRMYAPNVDIIYSPQWVPHELNFKNREPHKALKEGFNFTFAGNIGKVQNLENIIKGFSKASQYCPEIKLNIIGDGSELSHLKKITRNENISNVLFWGRRPLIEMPEWFEGSDILIISLINEPIFSLTVPAKFQAYIASGKPIFCVMNGEVAELIKKNKLGFISHPDDIEDIAAVFKKISKTSKIQLEQFGKNMKVLLENDYDRDKIIQLMTSNIFYNQNQFCPVRQS